jgi:hypothetical protein
VDLEGARVARANLALAVDYPLSHDDVRPWKTTALVASLVAAVELIVLVAAGVALLGQPLAAHAKDAAIDRVAPAAARPAPVQEPNTSAKLPRAETSVFVLNGNGRSGAAAQEAADVRAHGYVIGGTGNASRSDYPRSVVMYRAGFEGEARRLAHDLAIRVVGPLDGMKPGELLGAHVVVVLGAR